MCNHFVAAEVAADVIPLAATVDDLAAGMEFQGAPDPRSITHLVDQLRAQHQWPVVELVGRLRPVGGEKTIEVPLACHIPVQQKALRVVWLGQFQAACLPVLPAAGTGQILRQALGQFVGIFPAAQA
ncbi:hypothetical protein D3C81_1690000 [compost metagenome]